MKFESACGIAMDYFKKEYDDVGLYSIQDLGEKWLFEGADAELSVIYGKPGVTIDKKTGKFEFFHLPDAKNFKLLDSAVDLDIPEEYRIN